MNMPKKLGLKPTLLYTNESDIVSFKSVVVPSSMRSPLWKYFGFPADENRQIMTKTKIVCCICYNLIAYNKNTTNLSTHLTNKHPEILTTVKRERTDSSGNTTLESPKRKLKSEMAVNWMQQPQHPTGITQKTFPRAKRSIYKPKFQITDALDDLDDEPVKSAFDDITEHDHENQFIETIDYGNIDIQDGNEIIAEVLDAESVLPKHTNRQKNDFLSAQYITIGENNEVLYESSPKKLRISTKSPQKSSETENRIEIIGFDDIMDQMKKFLIKDLVKPGIVDGSGFKDMISFLSHNTDIPNSVQIEESIEKDYKQQHKAALSIVTSALDSRCYSLLFHRLGNTSIVEISINYWADGSDRISELRNQSFCISKNCTNSLISFGKSLSNCSAIVVDFDLESELDGIEVRELLEDIPIIPTFSYVTKIAFEACLQLSAIKTVVESADEVMGGKVDGAHTWLQKFEYLSQFLNEPNNIENSQIIQVLIESMRPLKEYLHDLAFVPAAYASIMKPLMLQAIHSYYSDSELTQSTDSDIVVLEKDLKRTIFEVFQRHIMDNPFLAMASFLDPRFQMLTVLDDLKPIRDELEKSVQNDAAKSAGSKSLDKPSRSKSGRNFGLSSLFSNLSPVVKSQPPKNRFDIEFRSYREDVTLGVDFCPLEWWIQNEHIYPSIKQHVKKYFCVPSFVNNVHRMSLSDQEELEQLYKRLEQDEPSEKQLWLHLNELRKRSFETIKDDET